MDEIVLHNVNILMAGESNVDVVRKQIKLTVLLLCFPPKRNAQLGNLGIKLSLNFKVVNTTSDAVHGQFLTRKLIITISLIACEGSINSSMPVHNKKITIKS